MRHILHSPSTPHTPPTAGGRVRGSIPILTTTITTTSTTSNTTLLISSIGFTRFPHPPPNASHESLCSNVKSGRFPSFASIHRGGRNNPHHSPIHLIILDHQHLHLHQHHIWILTAVCISHQRRARATDRPFLPSRRRMDSRVRVHSRGSVLAVLCSVLRMI